MNPFLQNMKCWVLPVTLGLALAGCENKVSRENYDKLAIGQEYAKVVELLGEPENCQSVVTVKNCVWGKEPKTISVQFMGEKILFYSNSGL
ncbi:MAG: DUF3862 domain-containing protein [Methylococcus sp.]|nr:DUF3862 domain-containing protein [Methylococcus sp.]